MYVFPSVVTIILILLYTPVWWNFSNGAVWECGSSRVNNTSRWVETDVGGSVHVSVCVETDKSRIARVLEWSHDQYTKGRFIPVKNITNKSLQLLISFKKAKKVKTTVEVKLNRTTPNAIMGQGRNFTNKEKKRIKMDNKAKIAFVNLTITKVRKEDFNSGFLVRVFAKENETRDAADSFLFTLTLREKAQAVLSTSTASVKQTDQNVEAQSPDKTVWPTQNDSKESNLESAMRPTDKDVEASSPENTIWPTQNDKKDLSRESMLKTTDKDVKASSPENNIWSAGTDEKAASLDKTFWPADKYVEASSPENNILSAGTDVEASSTEINIWSAGTNVGASSSDNTFFSSEKDVETYFSADKIWLENTDLSGDKELEESGSPEQNIWPIGKTEWMKSETTQTQHKITSKLPLLQATLLNKSTSTTSAIKLTKTLTSTLQAKSQTLLPKSFLVTEVNIQQSKVTSLEIQTTSRKPNTSRLSSTLTNIQSLSSKQSTTESLFQQLTTIAGKVIQYFTSSSVGAPGNTSSKIEYQDTTREADIQSNTITVTETDILGITGKSNISITKDPFSVSTTERSKNTTKQTDNHTNSRRFFKSTTSTTTSAAKVALITTETDSTSVNTTRFSQPTCQALNVSRCYPKMTYLPASLCLVISSDTTTLYEECDPLYTSTVSRLSYNGFKDCLLDKLKPYNTTCLRDEKDTILNLQDMKSSLQCATFGILCISFRPKKESIPVASQPKPTSTGVIDPLMIGVPLVVLFVVISFITCVIIYQQKATSAEASISNKQQRQSSDKSAEDTVMYANLRDAWSNETSPQENKDHVKLCENSAGQQPNLSDQDSGRVISDEGLVYVTVVHTGTPPKKDTGPAKAARKGKVNGVPPEIVEYTTFDFYKSAQLVQTTDAGQATDGDQTEARGHTEARDDVKKRY